MRSRWMAAGIAVVAWLLPALPATAAGPYVQVGAGVSWRDVVEEGKDLVDFKIRGNAVSTRVLATAGVNLGDYVDLYVQGGGADLSVDEFNNYNADLSGAYGGGARITLYRSGTPDDLRLYVEGNALRFNTDDRIQGEVLCTAGNGCAADTGEPVSRIVTEKVDWTEYVARFGASGRGPGTRLYGGVRLSMVDGKDRIHGTPDANFSQGFTSRLDLKQDDIFGLFFGLDMYLDRSEKTAVIFEASIFDEDAIQLAFRRAF